MRRLSLLLALCATSPLVLAAGSSTPGFFGPVDTALAPKPDLIHERPVLANGSVSRAKPQYLHVRPGEHLHWSAHCHNYGACDVPVVFVTESWYRTVYLPRAAGGTEQLYAGAVREERQDREGRHQRCTDGH